MVSRGPYVPPGAKRDCFPACKLVFTGAQGLHRALLGAHDEERLADHRDAEVVAGVRDLLAAPDADPGPREDGLALDSKNSGEV